MESMERQIIHLINEAKRNHTESQQEQNKILATMKNNNNNKQNNNHIRNLLIVNLVLSFFALVPHGIKLAQYVKGHIAQGPATSPSDGHPLNRSRDMN